MLLLIAMLLVLSPAQHMRVAAAEVAGKAETEEELRLRYLLNGLALHFTYRLGEPVLTNERPTVNVLPMPGNAQGREAWFRTANGASWAVVQVMPIIRLGGADHKVPLIWKGHDEVLSQMTAGLEASQQSAQAFGMGLFPYELQLSDALDGLVKEGKLKSVRRTSNMAEIKLTKLGSQQSLQESKGRPRRELDVWVVGAYHMNRPDGSPVTLTVLTTRWGNSVVRLGWITTASFKYMRRFMEAAGDSVRDLRP
ncbi:MAG: hypothetical protein ACAI35_00600 [Candidatus Methylacidiphilales bacterium]|nr:hypothetical protein [Candidatus Methylacidiphilales bacterium]